ncbi:MAG: DUF1080 domain-containing protein [Acidobacteria bacterium]|nr:DUF1080 domain-containing protein [Acidobacteriota bacterium]
MRRWIVVAMACVVAVAVAEAQDRPLNQPPPGFTALFNGRDLSGWRGRKPNFNPADEQRTLTKAEVAALQVLWNAERDQHWRVDTAKAEIVSDGNSPHLATVADYGDFELWVDWLMVSPNGDSGIYLRGYPQVQIWDPSNPREQRNGADKGSGALWNNNPDNPGRFPLVKADKPIGQWNTLRVLMVGQKVSIWLNGQQTVNEQVMDNYFDPNTPHTRPLVAKGPIELQTHGSEMRFRNVFVREIPASSAGTAR